MISAEPKTFRAMIAEWRSKQSLPSNAHWNDSKWRAAIELEQLIEEWNEHYSQVDQYEGASLINRMIGELL